MEIFVMAKTRLKFLGLIHQNQGHGHLLNILQRIVGLFLTFSIGSLSIVSILFDCATFAEQSEAGVACIVGCANFSFFMILLLNRTLIFDLFRTLEEKIAERERDAHYAAAMYHDANERSENFMKWTIWWMMNIAIKLMVFPTMIRSYYDYYINGLPAEESFYLAFRIWLPYTWNTPISYFFTMLVQYSTAHYSASCYISAFNIFYGICLFLNVFIADLEKSLQLLEDEMKQFEHQPLTMQSRYKLKKSFDNFVRWHAEVKGLVSKCSTDYHAVTSNFFISSVTVWCGILLQYSVGTATGNYFLIVRAFGLMLAWLPFYHMLNDSGESVTSAFGSLNESIFCKSWYLCPVDIQRYVILIMCMAQRPAYLEGFAHINFSRETFKKVMNNGYSYYMILRRFN